jgi:predicted transcriptional regulator
MIKITCSSVAAYTSNGTVFFEDGERDFSCLACDANDTDIIEASEKEAVKKLCERLYEINREVAELQEKMDLLTTERSRFFRHMPEDILEKNSLYRPK